MKRSARSLHAARVTLAVIIAGTVSCSEPHDSAQSTIAQKALGGGVVARAGAVELPATLVADVATARRVSPREATMLLVDDALLAQAARAAKLDADLHNVAKVRAAQARLALDHLLAVQDRTPATDQQVGDLTKELWAQVDRGEARRVTHAIVMAAKVEKNRTVPDSPEGNARRQALAERIHAAVRDAKTVTEFGSLASAIPTDGLEVKVEGLPAIVEDGRALDDTPFDPAFTAGVFAVPEGQQVSPVVKSDFGWHIVYVTERMPAVHVPFEERRARATKVLVEKRFKASYDAHLLELKKQFPVEISSAAEADLNAALSTPR